MPGLHFPIQYSDIFEGKVPQLAELFKFFTRRQLVDFAFIITNNSLLKSDFVVLCNHIFVSSGSSEAINLIQTKLKPSYFGKHCLAGIHTGVELQRQIFSLDPHYEPKRVSEREKEWALFKIVLIINEMMSAPMKLTEIDPNDNLAIAYVGIVTSMPCDDLLNFDPRLLLVHAYKAQQLLLFCQQHENLNWIVEEFCRIHSCSCINEYICFMSKTFIQIFENGKNGFCQLNTHGDDEAFNEFIRKKLKVLSISVNETISLEDNIDYKAFRAKPIIEVAEGSFYVIAPTFLLNAFYNSIKFTAEALAKKHNIKIDVNSIISYEFTEQKLFYALLKDSIYPKAIHITGKYCNNLNISSPPDYYIRNWNDVYLFELKDYRLLASLRGNPQIKEITEYIDTRLVKKNNQCNGEVSNGAILQLVNNIDRVCKSQFKADPQTGKIKNIYPILVFGESSYVIPGMTQLLDNALKVELSKINIPNRIKIHNLLLLDIDSLIFFYNALASKNTDFKDLIKCYYNFTKGKQKPQNIMEILMWLTISFSSYLKQYKRKYIKDFDPTKIQI